MKIQATDVSNLLAVLAAKAPLNAPAFTGTATFANNVAITGTLSASNFSGTSSGTNTGDQTTITGNAGTASALAMPRTLAITGDLTWTSPNFDGSANVSAVGTLATVNANVGTFGNSYTIPIISVNAKGLVTAVSTNSQINATYLQGYQTGTSGAAIPLMSGANTWSGDQTFNNMIVNGNLTVAGTTTNINATNINVADAIITLASANTTAAVPYIGLRAERGTADAYFLWDESFAGFIAQTAAADDQTSSAAVPIKAQRFVSTVAVGSSPFIVTSTTLVPNLNVEFLGGLNSAFYRNAASMNNGTLSTARLPATTGDVTSVAGTGVNTLATVNSNVGTFGSAAAVPIVTVNAKGLVTAVSTAALGTSAVKNTGTSGNAVPLLDGVNTWSGLQTFSVGNGAVKTAPGFNNATPGLTVYSAMRAFSLVAGSSGSALAYDDAGQFVIGRDTGSNIVNGNVGGAVVPTVTFSSTGNSTFAGNVTAANLSGTNTGDQTTITGNAGTATKLQTARSLSITGDLSWATSFDGSGDATGSATLSTVNSNVGTFGSVSAIPVVTVNAKGLVTAVSTAAIGTGAWKNTGTSGNTIPLLDGYNTWSSPQVFNEVVAQKTGTGGLFGYVGMQPQAADPNHSILLRGYPTSASATVATAIQSANVMSFVEYGGDFRFYRADGTNLNQLFQIATTGVTSSGPISASNLSGTNTGDQTITLTGDVTGSGKGSFGATLASVNSNVGTFGSSAAVPVVTVNAKGLVTAVSTAALGTAATYNIGTSGANVPLLSTSNFFSADQRMRGLVINPDTSNDAGITIRPGPGSYYSSITMQDNAGNNIANFITGQGQLYIDSAAYQFRGGAATFAGSISASNLSGTNTGDQTTITGNAGSATKLQTARTISSTGDVSWSTSFDGSGNATGTATLASVNSNVGVFGGAGLAPVVTVNAKGLVTAVGQVFVPATGGFPSGINQSIAAADIRNITNPLTGLGYAKGVRFRFSSMNDDNGSPYADVIDLSTYQDASGGNINALYVSKGGEFRIVHKQSNSTDRTSWVSKTLAYTDSDITGGAARLTTARTISASGDFTWSVSFNGTGDASSPATLATVNPNVGTFGSSSLIVPTFNVDGKGRITSASQYSLGSAAGKNIGTSGNTVPTLDAGNTWSAHQTFSTASSTWFRAGSGSVKSIIETDGGGTAFLTGYDISSGSFTPLAIRGSTVSFTQLTGGLNIYSSYASPINPGGIHMVSSIPGISWDVSGSTSTDRNFALLNNYSTHGRLELLYSPSASTNPTTVALTVDALANTMTVNMALSVAGNISASNIGTAASRNIGTSGGNVPLLDGANTWSGVQTMSNINYTSTTTQISGVYDPYKTRGIFAMGPAYTLDTPTPVNGTYGNFYGLAYSFEPDYGAAGANAQSKSGLDHQILLMAAGRTITAFGKGVWTDGHITATGNVNASGGGNFSGVVTSNSGIRANIGNGFIRSTPGNGNATPGLTAISPSRALTMFAGVTYSGLIYDTAGGLVIGREAYVNHTNNGVGASTATVTFNGDGTTVFAGNVSGPNIATTNAANVFSARQTISVSDQANSRLNINNTASNGNRTFSLVAGVHNETQEGLSIYDNVANATRLIIGNDGTATFRANMYTTGVLSVAGTSAQYGANIAAGFYGDATNVAIRALNDSNSRIYLQSYNGITTWGTVGNDGLKMFARIHAADSNLVVSADGVGPDSEGYAPFGVTRSPSATASAAYISMTRSGNVVWGMGIDNQNRMILGCPNGAYGRPMSSLVTIRNDGTMWVGNDINIGANIALNKGRSMSWGDSNDEIRIDDAPAWTGLANTVTFKSFNGPFVFRNSNSAQTVATITATGDLVTKGTVLINGGDPVITLSGRSQAYPAGKQLAVGWYTIATNIGNRASARFGLRDTSSGNHQSVIFYATHQFGNANTINVLSDSRYGGSPFRYMRIMRGSTYDGAMLQVYIDNDGNNNDVEVQILGDNHQVEGWVLKNWVPEGTNPGGLGNYAACTTADFQLDLDTFANGSATIGTSRVNKLYLGYAGGPATSPNFIKMDNGYVNKVNDPTNLKIFLYDNGSGDTYGFGLNNDSGVEYHASANAAAGKHRFYVGGSLRGSFQNSGLEMGNYPVYSNNPDYGVRFKIGGTTTENLAGITVTNGNLHLDAASGYETYINYYRGNAVNIGNGTNGIIFRFTGGDLVHAPTGGVYMRTNAGNTITAQNTFTPVQFLRDGFTSSGVSGDSGATVQSAYQWGYQEAGPWNYPYPDLVIGYHTGMKFGAMTNYGGMRFYDNHPSATSTILFSIGDGDTGTRVMGPLITTAGVALNDNAIYFRSNGDTNHLIKRGYETNFGQVDGIAHRYYQYLSFRSAQTNKYSMLVNGATNQTYFDEAQVGVTFLRTGAWDTTAQGGGAIGSIHLGSSNSTANCGGGISFGARDDDTQRGRGNNAQAGIYVTSDGTYGTRMYLSTTNSYATGAQTSMSIDQNGTVNITRSSLSVSGGISAGSTISAPNTSISGTATSNAVNVNSLYVNGVVYSIGAYFPTNGAIRCTPNLHLNSMPGNAVILNWDSGAVAGGTMMMRVGNGQGSDAFYVRADGGIWSSAWGNLNEYFLKKTDWSGFFNNQGDAHASYPNADNILRFGPNFVQASGPESAQAYTLSLGLGGEYSAGDYQLQLLWPRQSSNYMWRRIREGGSWQGWAKVNAGYADSAGSASSANYATSAGSATNANTVGGWGPTMSNVANSVAVRDGSCYISASGIHGAGAGLSNNINDRKAVDGGSVPWYGFGFASPSSGTRVHITGYYGVTIYAESQGIDINSPNGTKIQGRQVSDNVGANTLVTRDPSGYTNLNYINCNTGNEENPGINQVIVTNGSDNYYRKAGLGHFTNYVFGQLIANTRDWNGSALKVYSTGGNTNNYAGDATRMQVFSPAGQGAIMAFHRGGNYAINFGLDSDNVFRLGGWSAPSNLLQIDMSGNLTMSGNVTAYSDARLKTNVRTITGALDRVKAMRGVWFDHLKTGKSSSGVIAQEFEEQAPELVLEDNAGMKSVNYGASVGYLIEAIKELAEQNAALMARVAELEKR